MSTSYAERPARLAVDDAKGAAIRARLISPMPTDRLAGWLLSIAVAVIAAAMRFNRLGVPPGQVFDEAHYRKHSHDVWRYAVERNPDNPEIAGYVVHPPLGKWMLGWSQRAFDWDDQEIYSKTLSGAHAAFSWRFGAAVIGVLTVLLLCRLGRRLFRSTLLGCFAGLLMTLDGLHFVQSRVVMLDIALLFWIIAAAACMLADRDDLRRRLADRISPSPADPPRRTPIRWWRIATGISIGFACGVKWSGVYLIPAFVLLSLAWEIGARRTAGVPKPVRAALLHSAVPIVAALVIVPVVAYLGTWLGWFVTETGWRRDCALAKPGGPWSGMKHPEMCGPVKGLWQYHAEALAFHNQLVSAHSHQSHTWGWLLLARPVNYFLTHPRPGYVQQVLAVGTPAVWWGSIFALAATTWKWLSARDWRAAFILTGFAATYLPWFWNDINERTMYNFYALAALPFMCLALTYCAGLVLAAGPRGAPRRRWRIAAVAGFLGLVLANFYFMYPVYAASVLPRSAWRLRIWLSTWV